MSSDQQPLPLSREAAAEEYFKSWDDAAARLVRSVFLLGAGLLGLLLLPLLLRSVLEATLEPLSLAGFYEFSASVGIALIFFSGSLGSLFWGVVVLAGSVNAAILAGGQSVPESTGPVLSSILRVFSKERPFLALVLPAVSLGVVLVVVLVTGLDASKELIRNVFRALGVSAP